MKRITLVIAAVMTVLMLASCSSGKVIYGQRGEKLPATGKSWTVLVYMCGGDDETASGAASQKLNQLMSVDYPENVNVVVETGGSSKWHKKGVYVDYIQRFEMGKGTMYLADQTLTANMGDYRTLADFLSWGTSAYKSDKYMLILSGAGGGCVSGMAYDELNGGDSLSLEEISYALTFANKKFDIVGLDSSLMCSIETAGALYTSADYMIASQEVIGGSGWDYAGFLKYICSNPAADADEIGKVICDTYYERCKKNGTEKDATMSVVDMSKISSLSQAFDGMAGDMLTATDSLQGFVNLSSAMRDVQIFGGATADEGYSNIVDMGDIAVRIRENVGKTADVLINSLNNAVLYRVCGERKQRATGLSVYYPLMQDNDELQAYMEIATSNKYKEFLKKICTQCSVTDGTDSEDFTSSWAWNDYNNDMQYLEYKSILDNNIYELNILGNMSVFKDIYINVYKKDKKSGEYVYLGKYTNLESDWEAGIFKDSFDGKMIKLFGKDVTMRLVSRCDGYDLYSAPVIINSEAKYVRVMHKLDENKYEVIGAWDGVDRENGKAGNLTEKTGLFDRVTPVLSVYDEEHKKNEYISGSFGMKLFGGAKRSVVGNGDYILEYALEDVYGNCRRGTPVKGKVTAGKIQFE